jgi:lipopolysaccharide/colanic/teichoic acid biosynthesis glycosyltransferase/cellulose synthase/poly-beta-1,6-N-acetylglucosamine synthase-like glycosyltransferase
MSIETILIFSLCLLTGITVYHHVIYPSLMRLAARSATGRQSRPSGTTLPTMSIVVPAYREAAYIADMVRQLAELDYPAEKLECIIACDGSPDRTPQLALEALEAFPHAMLRIDSFPENRGKVALLNELIREARGEIIVLLDASSAIGPDFAREIAAKFADPAVGVVCPGYALGAASTGEVAYWNMQCGVRTGEGAVAAPMGAHGAGYAFRKAFWEPLPAETINDDFVLPMRMVMRGAKAIYCPDLLVREREESAPVQDFGRRRRLGAGNLQQVVLCAPLAWACGWRTSFLFLSGKGLRGIMPAILALMLVLSVLLAMVGSHPLNILPLLVLGPMAALGLVALFRPAITTLPLVGPIAYGLGSYGAMLAGMADYISGGYQDERRPPTLASSGLDERTEHCKRVFDILIASLAFTAFAILTPFIALAIRLDSKGPVFYRQLRVGRAMPDRTELFYLVKFRTMRVDAEAATGAVWAAKGDPRVTRLGRFLRNTRLDELPQCINVLRGEMSIVGPRPERPVFFTKLEGDIPFYAERTYGLKPGVTGLAQVSTGYDSTIDDVRLKILFDHSYALLIRSPWQWLKTDCRIILKTILVMGLGMGR